jgi:hypothetical protein
MEFWATLTECLVVLIEITTKPLRMEAPYTI